jgi:Chaperonin 10 Kd subunit
MPTVTKAKPKIQIYPLEDRVVILPAEEEETMRGPLYIPDTVKEKPTQGEVREAAAGMIPAQSPSQHRGPGRKSRPDFSRGPRSRASRGPLQCNRASRGRRLVSQRTLWGCPRIDP